jgi:putative YhbY family RNA-binding protein
VKKDAGNRAETVEGRRANARDVAARIALSQPPEERLPFALVLTPAERRALRAAAHPLQAVVMVGREGLNDAVLREAESAIRVHQLIKVRVLGEDRAERQLILESLCERLSCAPVQAIGKLLVLYRPSVIA